MLNIRGQQEMYYHQMYILSTVTNKELLPKEGGEQSTDNSAEEVSKVYLKKLSILLKKQLKTKRLEVLVEH